jgi:putative tricarboxylic transport membrane protein
VSLPASQALRIAPIIMGLVLGGLVETSLAQSMLTFDQQWTGFLSRPIALVSFALALASKPQR